jgi:hypothetical protein
MALLAQGANTHTGAIPGVQENGYARNRTV